MKKLSRILSLIFVCVLLFSACASKKIAFEMDPRGYRDSKSGTVYRAAGENYRCVGYDAGDLVGTYTSRGGTVVNFYRVAGLEGVVTDGDYQVYYSADVSLPAFADMNLDHVDLCYSNAITVPYRSFDASNADRIRGSILNGAALPFSSVSQVQSARYDLVFQCAGNQLAYRLIYLSFDSEVLIYEPLTEDGQIPDLYPGVRAEKTTGIDGKEVAVFHFGNQLVYDRTTKTCYPVEKLTPEAS